MTEPLKTVGNVSISSYQSLDGSNCTVAGVEEKLNIKKGYVSAFAGAATDFNKKNRLCNRFKRWLQLRQKRNF